MRLGEGEGDLGGEVFAGLAGALLLPEGCEAGVLGLDEAIIVENGILILLVACGAEGVTDGAVVAHDADAGELERALGAAAEQEHAALREVDPSLVELAGMTGFRRGAEPHGGCDGAGGSQRTQQNFQGIAAGHGFSV